MRCAFPIAARAEIAMVRDLQAYGARAHRAGALATAGKVAGAGQADM
jgi:hypothetical protein